MVEDSQLDEVFRTEQLNEILPAWSSAISKLQEQQFLDADQNVWTSPVISGFWTTMFSLRQCSVWCAFFCVFACWQQKIDLSKRGWNQKCCLCFSKSPYAWAHLHKSKCDANLLCLVAGRNQRNEFIPSRRFFEDRQLFNCGRVIAD